MHTIVQQLLLPVMSHQTVLLQISKTIILRIHHHSLLLELLRQLKLDVKQVQIHETLNSVYMCWAYALQLVRTGIGDVMLWAGKRRVQGAVNTRDTSKCGRAGLLVLSSQAADCGASLALVSDGRWVWVWRPDGFLCLALAQPCSFTACVTHACISKDHLLWREFLEF